MHIGLLIWDRLPVPEYGGTQRLAVWLARGLAAAGHQVSLLAAPGSVVPEATLVPVDPRAAHKPGFDVRPHLPRGVEVLLSFVPLGVPPEVPWIRQLSGNRKPGTVSPPNTLYVSADHARRHGATAWVYNGLDPADFDFSRDKDDYDLFLGRLHSAKGFHWAIEGARQGRRRLLVAGGWRPSLSRYVKYVGAVGGARKAALLAGARALWMPALWDEPFGYTIVEALVSGTPVLGTHRGALPELISADVGVMGDSVEELVALRPVLDRLEPEACRARVERYFTHHVMAAGYLRAFQHFLATGELPPGEPLPSD